jgi:hypothetical protein
MFEYETPEFSRYAQYFNLRIGISSSDRFKEHVGMKIRIFSYIPFHLHLLLKAPNMVSTSNSFLVLRTSAIVILLLWPLCSLQVMSEFPQCKRKHIVGKVSDNR